MFSNRHGRRIQEEVRFQRNRSTTRSGQGRPETKGRQRLPGDRIAGEAVSITAAEKADSRAADSLRTLSSDSGATVEVSAAAIGNLAEEAFSAVEGAGAAENLVEAASEAALAEAVVVSVANGAKL